MQKLLKTIEDGGDKRILPLSLVRVWFNVHINGEIISATPSHPFYVPKLGWTSAIKLRAGDILVLFNGEYVVVEAVQHEILESPVKVYNFEVEDFHTYFVGESSVLVHNMCAIDTESDRKSVV